MKKLHVHHAWLVLGAYGAWFAIFSGAEEVAQGKVWKVILSLLLGFAVYLLFEAREKSK